MRKHKIIKRISVVLLLIIFPILMILLVHSAVLLDGIVLGIVTLCIGVMFILSTKVATYLSNKIYNKFWRKTKTIKRKINVENIDVDDLKKKIDKQMVYGELDHDGGLDVTLSKVSHLINDIDSDGNIEIKILDTDTGYELQKKLYEMEFVPRIKDGKYYTIDAQYKDNINESGFIHWMNMKLEEAMDNGDFEEVENLKRDIEKAKELFNFYI